MLELDPPQVAAPASGVSGTPELPPAPRTLRDTGLERQLVVELLAKSLYLSGKSHLPVLTKRLRLSINVLREILDFMVAEQLAEVCWRGDSDLDVQYQLTTAGKQRAAAWLERHPYAGPAPVPLEAYRAMVERQARQADSVTADDLAAELAEDGLAPSLLDTLGAALYSGRAILLYGPPGSGKTSLAHKLGRLRQGLVAVPHAVAVGPDIVQVYDPAVHRAPSPRQATHARQALERQGGDQRWLLCQRPVLKLGAELSAEMLEPRPDARGGACHAPPQFKANNGMLIIDDLGRQRASAAELLNRYLQPLDAGVDQLALPGGQPFTVPFDVTLVLVSNHPPEALLDGAALRRLGYKIHIGPLSETSYRALFRQQCRVAGVAFEDAALRYLIEELHGGSGQPLLASYPRELLGRIADFAGYAGVPPRLSLATLDQAWISLFAASAPAAPSDPDGALYERIG